MTEQAHFARLTGSCIDVGRCPFNGLIHEDFNFEGIEIVIENKPKYGLFDPDRYVTENMTTSNKRAIS